MSKLNKYRRKRKYRNMSSTTKIPFYHFMYEKLNPHKEGCI